MYAALIGTDYYLFKLNSHVTVQSNMKAIYRYSNFYSHL